MSHLNCDKNMSSLPNVFKRFIPQLLHMVVLPIFFFAFLLLYRPLEVQTLLGVSYFGVHITLLSCIILLTTIIVRLLYYFLPLKLNYSLYGLWCLAEMIFMSFFIAIYFWLVLRQGSSYYQNLTSSFQLVFMTLIIPYAILALSIRIQDYHERSLIDSEPYANKRMRFYDQKHNLKLVLMPQAVLYIASDENYVNINYIENSKVRTFVLRSSMKAIEDLCVENGLVRCHRSFFVNPSHVKILRKEPEGVVLAELDAPDVRHIPVTKRYYDKLASLL